MRRITGRTILEIRLLGQVDRAVSLLREQPLVEDISGEDNVIEVSFSGNDQEMAELLRLLINHEVPVMTFAREEGSLEEVFMEVTKNFEQ